MKILLNADRNLDRLVDGFQAQIGLVNCIELTQLKYSEYCAVQNSVDQLLDVYPLLPHRWSSVNPKYW